MGRLVQLPRVEFIGSIREAGRQRWFAVGALMAGALVFADVPLLPAEVGVCRFRPMPEATVLEISIPQSPSRQ